MAGCDKPSPRSASTVQPTRRDRLEAYGKRVVPASALYVVSAQQFGACGSRNQWPIRPKIGIRRCPAENDNQEESKYQCLSRCCSAIEGSRSDERFVNFD